MDVLPHYRTPSPERKPELEFTPPQPEGVRPRRTPRAPTKAKSRDSGFVYYQDDSDADELAYLDEDSEQEEEEEPTPSKKGKSNKGRAVKQPKQPKVKKNPDVWDDIPDWHDDNCPIFSLPSEMCVLPSRVFAEQRQRAQRWLI